ncbi:MAG: hypothetical protein ACLQIB_34195 [Isosphaeraceae bacterium]
MPACNDLLEVAERSTRWVTVVGGDKDHDARLESLLKRVQDRHFQASA